MSPASRPDISLSLAHLLRRRKAFLAEHGENFYGRSSPRPRPDISRPDEAGLAAAEAVDDVRRGWRSLYELERRVDAADEAAMAQQALARSAEARPEAPAVTIRTGTERVTRRVAADRWLGLPTDQDPWQAVGFPSAWLDRSEVGLSRFDSGVARVISPDFLIATTDWCELPTSSGLVATPAGYGVLALVAPGTRRSRPVSRDQGHDVVPGGVDALSSSGDADFDERVRAALPDQHRLRWLHAGTREPQAIIDASRTLRALRVLRVIASVEARTSSVNLSALQQLEDLRVLTLEGVTIDEHGLHPLAGIERLRSIELLPEGDLTQALSGLTSLQGLKALTIEREAPDVDPAVWTSIGALTGLHELALVGPWVHDDGVEKLAGMTNLRRLKLQEQSRPTWPRREKRPAIRLTHRAVRTVATLPELRSLDIAVDCTGAELAPLESASALTDLVVRTNTTLDPEIGERFVHLLGYEKHPRSSGDRIIVVKPWGS